jgi:hypothetical protein
VCDSGFTVMADCRQAVVNTVLDGLRFAFGPDLARVAILVCMCDVI